MEWELLVLPEELFLRKGQLMKLLIVKGLVMLGGGLLASAQLPGYPPSSEAGRPEEPLQVSRDSQTLPPPVPSNSQVQGDEQRRIASQRELDRLQGTWGRIALEQNGQQTMGEDLQDQLIIRGDRFYHVTHGQLAENGTIRIVDPYGQNKRMFFIVSDGPAAGMKSPTLYSLEGNTLRAVQGTGANFPARLYTQPGDGLTLGIATRIGP